MGVDVRHFRDLVALFMLIALIYAQSIDPNPSRILIMANPREGLEEVSSNFE
jgi:hypothetical protein